MSADGQHQPKFKPVNPRLDIVASEEEILAFWDKEKIFQKTLDAREGAKRYVFFEGPPTANAKPALHHLLARYFKDLFPRYKTMQGYLVERKAGWDTHGLPVEIELEKELKLKSKPDIEKYGIAKFNEKAREKVWEQKEAWEKFTKRSGYWVDLDDPYITYDPKYIESVWWILKSVYDKGLIYRGHKVVPFCPRCGTALSSHEVALGYQEVEDTSVYVKFKVKGADNTSILAWTTTPWTLPGNVALAVGEKLKYSKVKVGDEFVILASELVEKVMGEGAEVVEEMTGKKLLGLEYEPIFPGAIETDKKAWYVVPADFVTVSDGTGVVHTAVMYGEDDYQLGEKLDLPKVHTVLEDGTFVQNVDKWAGRFVKDKEVEKEIIADLDDRGLLFKAEQHTHEYPFCWRCGTPLLYYATNSWFIAMSKLRKELQQNNKHINWIPSHIGEGRFGEWLKEVKDWAISRNRYWGTPLPFWMSEDGELLVIESYDDLRRLAKDPSKVGENFDPHRPSVDDIILVKDDKEYTRVPEVLDVWFDSGAMPYAQWHYPFENKERIDEGTGFPADFISEAIDQTRGWFYTLLAINTLLGYKKPPYKNVICLGHINDAKGKKMSKSKGNVVDPWEMFDKYGSDVIRWYFYTINQPGLPKNFDEKELRTVMSRFVLTLWNTYSFFVMYANIDKFDPNIYVNEKVPVQNVLDAWIMERKEQTVNEVTSALDKYDPMQACLTIEGFVSDLSNWYVRRSRRRFWKNEGDADKNQAYFVLWSVLTDLTKLLAPFMPMLSEAMYQNLRLDSAPESVHLAAWPTTSKGNQKILTEMQKLRDLVEAGLNQRDVAKIKIRQPLASFSITEKLNAGLLDILKEELNVKEIITGAKEAALNLDLTPELIREGLARELVRNLQVLRKDSGLEVTDHIAIKWSSDDEEVKALMGEFGDYVATETLADSIEEATGKLPEMKINDRMISISIEKN